MVKITDVLGAMLEAQLKTAEWEQEFQAQFFGPLVLAQQVQQFLSTPPEERAALPPEQQAPMIEHARRMQKQMTNEPMQNEPMANAQMGRRE